MTRVKLNIIANFLGQSWIYVLQLSLVPIYLAALGAEAYALVGLFAMLYGASQLFDLGLGHAASRAVARWSSNPEVHASPRLLLGTILPIYAALGCLLVLSIFLLAPFIGDRLIKAQDLAPEIRILCIRLMGVAVAFQWMQGLFLGILAGLQRQIAVNLFRAAFATTAGLGAVTVLTFGPQTAISFFEWHAAVAAMGLGVAILVTMRALPSDVGQMRFTPAVLKPLWRFAIGVSLTAAIGLLLSQTDKWIVLSIAPLEKFTQYAIAAAAAMALYGFVQPVLGALFPRMSALVGKSDEDTLRGVYHAGAQLVAALAFSMGLMLAVFAHEALLLWTRNGSVASGAAPIARMLVLGTMLNCIMFVPYNLQLAFGWTRLGVYTSLAFLMCMVPASILLASRYGPIGCAIVWFVLNCTYYCLGTWLTHRRVLSGEASAWYLRDTLPCLASGLAVTGLARLAFPAGASPWAQLIFLVAAGAATLLVCLLVVPQPRAWLLTRGRRARHAFYRP